MSHAATPISVIVPAHDEAAVIGRCLDALTRGARPGELEVIVVCNGCRDATAEIARGYGAPVRVIETEVAGKSHALNLGDETARSFPRFYVDADVELPLASLRRVAEVLRGGRVLAAAPAMRLALDDRGALVRAYFAIWTRLPYVTDGLVGSGVYALSEAGRARFERFPDLFAEDGFVRALFGPGERESVADAHFVVHPPTTLRGIVRVNARRRVGYEELRALLPAAVGSDAARQRGALRELASQPRLWPAIAIYVASRLATVALYRSSYRGASRRVWYRDLSSRSRGSDEAPAS